VTDVGILEAHDIAAKFGQLQPERHLSLEHATLAERLGCARSLAGDHEHEAGPVALRPLQESEQHGVRLALSLAMQVDAGDGFGCLDLP
jgi:hypothetical protein